MNVCFYSPYIPKHFGGGEKHVFDVAVEVAKKHTVSIALPEAISQQEYATIKKKYEEFLNYKLEGISFVPTPIPTGSFLTKLLWTAQFDYLYYATDGSLFFSLAKKNNLHIQIPFTQQKNSFMERLKLLNWNIKNTNSHFTKSVIEKSWRTKVDLVQTPLVSLKEIPFSKKKEKVILNVGRFFTQLHSKRQDVLVRIFKKMHDEYPQELKGWKLVLVGSVEDQEYLQKVIKLAHGYPIEIKTECSRTELITLYQSAAIYWHATGFEVDQDVSPEKVEHFGITTIEAMAAGCVPIVIAKGGQIEILGTNLQDLLWNTLEECSATTISVVTNQKLREAYQAKSFQQVKNFSKEVFVQKVWQMF